jgi:hypothetical protein
MHRKNLGPWGDPERSGGVAVSVRCDEASHSGAVTINVALAVAARVDEVDAWEHVTGEVGVRRVYTGVDDSNGKTCSFVAEALSLGNIQEPKVPLRVADVVGVGRAARQ